MVFSNSFDMADKIKYDLQILFDWQKSIAMYTDSFPLFAVLTKVNVTTEKLFMISQ